MLIFLEKSSDISQSKKHLVLKNIFSETTYVYVLSTKCLDRGGNLVQQINYVIFFQPLFKPIIIHKIFETNSSFHVKQRTTGNVWFLFFKRFLLVLTKFSFWQEEWVLGYHSMKFRHLPDISLFPMILSYKSFDNSWGKSYIPCL